MSMSRIAFHWTYLNCAHSHLLRASHAADRRAEADRASLEASLANNWGDSGDAGLAALHYADEMSEAVLGAVLFAALMLEAYINNLAILKLSGWYRENVDKLDLPAKWILVPKLIYGKGLEPSDDLVSRIDKLQKLRNKLVHARSITMTCETYLEGVKKHRMGLDRAQVAIETCERALEFMKVIDPVFETGDYDQWRQRRNGLDTILSTAAEKFESSRKVPSLVPAPSASSRP